MYKKIHLYLKNKNRQQYDFYLATTNSSKTLKEAVANMVSSLKKHPQTKRAYENKLGQKIVYKNIYAAFN